MRACLFPLCVCTPPDGRDYCELHRPEAILARAKQVVWQRFDPFIETEARHNWRLKLRDDILRDLELIV